MRLNDWFQRIYTLLTMLTTVPIGLFNEDDTLYPLLSRQFTTIMTTTTIIITIINPSNPSPSQIVILSLLLQ